MTSTLSPAAAAIDTAHDHWQHTHLTEWACGHLAEDGGIIPCSSCTDRYCAACVEEHLTAGTGCLACALNI